MPFYFLNRATTSEIGMAIRKLEEGFYNKLDLFFSGLSKDEKRRLFAMFFGLVFVPNTVHADPGKGVELLLKVIR